MDVLQIGKYTILDALATGRTANAYRAVDPTTNRVVFLKVLNIPAGISSTDRHSLIDHFYGEARSAGGLTHPNIVTLYEVGEDLGYHYIAMEYLEGASVRKLLDRDRYLSFSQAMEIARSVCRALDYAHKRGVIHRDVKPDNIIVLEDGQVKLTDFGIARIEGDIRKTQVGIILGSPAYMSPEQIKGTPIDKRTDIFSLGVCLYEMLSGRKPFDAPTATAVMHCIVKEPPQPLEDIPDALRDILWTALAKDPESRYPGAAEMLADLNTLEAGSLTIPPRLASPADNGDREMIENTLQPTVAPPSVEALRASLQEAPKKTVPRRFSIISFMMVILLIGATATGTYLYARRDFDLSKFFTPAIKMPPASHARALSPVDSRITRLADFEVTSSGWEPAFDQTATGFGDLSLQRGGAAHGRSWLRVGGIRFHRTWGYERAGVYYNPDNNDWHLLGNVIRVEIFLPPRASRSIRACLGIRDTLREWHWMPESKTSLIPGQWNTVQWKADERLLSDVSRLAVLIEGTSLSYRGAFGIDALCMVRK